MARTGLFHNVEFQALQERGAFDGHFAWRAGPVVRAVTLVTTSWAGGGTIIVPDAVSRPRRDVVPEIG